MDLFRQTVVDADVKQGAVQRLSQMDIKLIGQTLLIAEVHPGLCPETGNHTHDGATQALILLVFIHHRVGCAKHHKQQRQEQLFIAVRSLRDAPFPVADNFLCRKVFPSGLRPAALNGRKLRRIAQMMLNQTILQIEL